jgi:hypothetical protein
MALLNLANNPTLSTSGTYTLGSTYAQFQPSLAVQPTTFAVSLIVGMIGALTAGTAQAWDTAYTLQDITVTNTGTLPISFTAATGTSNFAYTGNS